MVFPPMLLTSTSNGREWSALGRAHETSVVGVIKKNYTRHETVPPCRPRSSLSPKVVILEDVRHTGGHFLAGGDVEELVGAVGVGVRAEDAGNEELGVGKLLPQHPHERNRATPPHRPALGLQPAG